MRISNPYGERQRPRALQGAAAVFLHKAILGEEVEIWGDGSVTRDYLHIHDVARAVLLLTDYTGGNKIFNIGGGHGYSLLDLVRIIEKVVNHPVKVRFTPARPFDVPVNVLDITRAREILKWRPEIGLEVGLQRTMIYLRNYEKLGTAPNFF
jgi:UDP-glucose 4-epimerase